MDIDDDLASEFLDVPDPVPYLPDFKGVDTNGWPRFDWSKAPEIYTAVIHGNETKRRQVVEGKDIEWINKSNSCGFFSENYIRMYNDIEDEFYEFTPNTGHRIQQSYADYMNRASYNGLFITFYESAEGYEIVYPFGREPHENCNSGIEFRPWMLDAGRGKSWCRDCDKTWFLMSGDLPSGFLIKAESLTTPELSRSLPHVQRGRKPIASDDSIVKRALEIMAQGEPNRSEACRKAIIEDNPDHGGNLKKGDGSIQGDPLFERIYDKTGPRRLGK